jgi:hypothetical protein
VLYPNYPNPIIVSSSSSTTIRLYNPEDGYVTLRLMNSLGQPIETLYDGTLPEGPHDFAFDARRASLPSGTYFVCMTAKNRTFVRTMQVIR